MKKTFIVVIAVVASSLLTWSLVRSDNHEPSVVKSEKSEIIIAEMKWNGELHQISLAELETAIAELPTYRQRNYASKAGKAEYLETYIDEKLKILQAKEAGFDKLLEHLKRLEEYTHQLMIEKLTEMEVDEKVTYTEKDLMAYYEGNKKDYIEAAQVRATCITLDDEDLANATLDQITEGKDIVELAKTLSEEQKLANGPGSGQDDPGNTFFFNKKASPTWSEFIDAVFEMEIGDMTETVFETDVQETTYYMIFRKEEAKPERQKEFTEVKSDVERKVKRATKRGRILEWIDEISKQAKLKTYPENIPAPVQTETPKDDTGTTDE